MSRRNCYDRAQITWKRIDGRLPAAAQLHVRSTMDEICRLISHLMILLSVLFRINHTSENTISLCKNLEVDSPDVIVCWSGMRDSEASAPLGTLFRTGVIGG